MPQQAWSAKRERQYEHIKDGLEEQGTSEGQGEGDRSPHGQQGAGADRRGEDTRRGSRGGHLLRPARRPSLRHESRQRGARSDQLYEEAKDRGIEGRSKMTKEQLRRAVDAKKR